MAKKDPYLGEGELARAAKKLKERKRNLDDMIDAADTAPKPKLDSAVRGHGSENRKKK